MASLPLEQLYTQTIDQVFRYVFSRVKNRALAEDIVSEAYLKAAEHLESFRPQKHATARSWLFTIVRNTLTDHYRARPTSELKDIHESSTPSVEHTLDIDLAHSRVMQYVGKLPDRQQEILLLRFQGELRNQEIAELLSLDEKSVSAALSKAISTLRYELSV